MAACSTAWVTQAIERLTANVGVNSARGSPADAITTPAKNSTSRAMRADRLAEAAREVFGDERVTVVPRLADAIDRAAAIAEEQTGSSIGSGAVLVTGSVVTVGEARALLKGAR